MVSFYCWDEPDEQGFHSGQWLGRLPIGPTQGEFGEPLTCNAGDTTCDRWLPTLQAQYPTALQQAQFQCAIKNGTLFTEFADQTVTVRCGFFATTVYDENGDHQPDYEDPASVDIPVTTLPLSEALFRSYIRR
jgi:hypothetical protein